MSEPALRSVSPAAERRARLHAIGTVCFIVGVCGMSVAALDMLDVLPAPLARWWLHSKALLILTSLVSLLAGCRLIWLARHDRPAWRPAAPGARFHTAVFYTRGDCELCEEAAEMLSGYRDYLPPPVEVDIDSDPALIQRFGTCVPVLELDGKVRFRGRISEPLLRRLIQATAPIHEPGRGRRIIGRR